MRSLETFCSKLPGLMPSALRDCSTFQFRCASLSELEFHKQKKMIFYRKRFLPCIIFLLLLAVLAGGCVRQTVIYPNSPSEKILAEISGAVAEDDILSATAQIHHRRAVVFPAHRNRLRMKKAKGKKQKAKGKSEKDGFAVFNKKPRSAPNDFCLLIFAFCLLPFSSERQGVSHMKNLRRVVWSRGMFLTPQHFQTLDRFLDDSLQFRFTASSFANWGVVDLGIDQESLTNGLFTVAQLPGRPARRDYLQHAGIRCSSARAPDGGAFSAQPGCSRSVSWPSPSAIPAARTSPNPPNSRAAAPPPAIWPTRWKWLTKTATARPRACRSRPRTSGCSSEIRTWMVSSRYGSRAWFAMRRGPTCSTRLSSRRA